MEHKNNIIKKRLTLAIIKKDTKVLLGMKKLGLGSGRFNGFGGKVEVGESIEDAAIREIREEVSLIANKIEKFGIINFSFENDPKILEVHIFKVIDFTGTPKESDEMKPEWFDESNIPFDQMWPGDVHWLPYLLNNKKFIAEFYFDRPSTSDYASKILSMKLNEIENL